MLWSTYSPNLNSKENVWYAMGRISVATSARLEPAQQLQTALQEKWPTLPQTRIDNLINLLSNICAAVLAETQRASTTMGSTESYGRGVKRQCT